MGEGLIWVLGMGPGGPRDTRRHQEDTKGTPGDSEGGWWTSAALSVGIWRRKGWRWCRRRRRVVTVTPKGVPGVPTQGCPQTSPTGDSGVLQHNPKVSQVSPPQSAPGVP